MKLMNSFMSYQSETKCDNVDDDEAAGDMIPMCRPCFPRDTIRASGYNFPKYCISLFEDLLNFINSVDPDGMQNYAAFHMGLHYL